MNLLQKCLKSEGVSKLLGYVMISRFTTEINATFSREILHIALTTVLVLCRLFVAVVTAPNARQLSSEKGPSGYFRWLLLRCGPKNLVINFQYTSSTQSFAASFYFNPKAAFGFQSQKIKSSRDS